MAYNLQPRGAAQMFADGAAREWRRPFGEDRGHDARGHGSPAPGGRHRRLPVATCGASPHMVEEQDFLFGAEPCVADFAAYHPLWFTRIQVPVHGRHPGRHARRAGQWMDRMAAIGHGAMEKFSAADAITVAQGPDPMPSAVPADQRARSRTSTAFRWAARSRIAAESFGPEPTEGELMAATRTHYTLRRDTRAPGTVHVHFPRIGYVLRKAEGA